MILNMFISVQIYPFRFVSFRKGQEALFKRLVIAMLNSNEFGPAVGYGKRTAVVSNVEINSVVSKIGRSVAGNDFRLAREEHIVALLPWRDTCKAYPVNALAELIRETFQRHGMPTLSDYPGVSRMQTESPAIPYKSPNLPRQNK